MQAPQAGPCTARRHASSRAACVLLTALAVLPALFAPASAFGGTFEIVNREFIRDTGQPQTITFTVQAPQAPYVLFIETDRVASAVVTLNGQVVVAPSRFNNNTTIVEQPVTLRASNTMSVEVRGKPGGRLRLRILGTDDDAPSIRATASPAANAAGWNQTDVTVSFTCDDAVSGIATCPVPVVITREGAGQVITGEAIDVAGNRATASVTLNIDKRAPSIAATLSRPANGAGWHNGPVTITFTCSDDGSGVASCTGPIIASAEGAGQVFTGTTVDRAGNTSSTGVTLNLDLTPPLVVAQLSAPPNASGWHKADVTVSYTCEDAGSRVVACPAPRQITTEGAGQQATVVVSDVAGNSTTSTTTVNLDKTPPGIAASISPAPNAAGWNNSPAVVSFACTDAVSGIAECTAPVTVTDEGAGQNVVGSATDLAGNAASSTAAISIDKTPPSISASVSQTGWTNGDVTVTFECSDALAGIASCPGARTISSEGSATVEGTAVDRAGNSATIGSTVLIDRTPPEITVSISPAANASGWHSGPVTATFSCADAASGIETCPADVVLASDGENQAIQGTARDRAGNVTTASAVVSIDTLPPSLEISAAPPANSDGWNNSDVAVSVTCADAGSGVVECPAPILLTGEGAGQQITRTITDRAGHSASASLVVNIDKTPPTLVFGIPAPPPNAAGWHAGDVTIPYSVSDALSGVASAEPPNSLLLTGEGTALTGIVMVTDRAGNEASFTSAPVRIDRTAPAIVASATPQANAQGWNNSAVTVTFQCSDEGSPVDCPAPVSVSSEGASQEVARTVTDAAGNSATASLTVNIDLTAPSILGAVSPPANAAGWHRSDVQVSFTCSDALAGVVSCQGPTSVTTEGAAQSIEGGVRDAAGNVAGTSVVVNLDRTPPAIQILSPASGATLRTAAAAVNGTANDSVSGVTGVACGAEAAVLSGNSFACGFALEPGGNTLRAFATDAAGNGAEASVAVLFDANSSPVARTGGPYAGETGTAIRFDASASTDPDGDQLTYLWSFGDGGTATGPAVTHAYTAAGGYAVELVVSDGRGGSSSSSTTATIVRANRSPVAVAGGPYAGDAGQVIVLDGSASSDPDGDPLVYRWEFGDGSGAAIAIGRRAYATPGNYVATLTVEDGRGGQHSANAQVTVRPMNQRPTARIANVSVAEAGRPVAFDGSASSDPDNDPLTLLWSFGDGSVGSGTSASHGYAQPGVFTVTLTVNDGRGGTHAASTQVTVAPLNQPPQARIDAPERAEVRHAVPFSAAASTDADGDALTYAWNFGDGRSATGASATHAFETAGPFTVSVAVSDGRGGSASATTQIQIDPRPAENRPPEARAGGPYSGEAGLPITFDGSASTDPDEDPLTMSWSFGDGAGGDGRTIAHAFDQPGTYAVTLTVSDGRGGTATATAQASISSQADRAPPLVQLVAPRDVLPGTEVVLRAEASDNVGVVSFNFEVGGTPGEALVSGPYQHTLAIPPVATPGSGITVRGLARDAAGNVGIAEAVLRIATQPDAEPPQVLLQVPPQAAPGTTVRFSATATDNDGVQAVVFTAAGAALAPDVDPPYQASYSIPADAVVGSSIAVVVEATDFTGNRGSARGAVMISETADTVPPQVVLSAPASVGPGGTIQLTATVSDDSGIALVIFSVNGARVGAVTRPPYEAQYQVPDGAAAGASLTCEARAIDSSGLEASDTKSTAILITPVEQGLVTGEVYDDLTGLPLPEASITAVPRAGGAATSTQSDSRGRFALTLPAGDALLAMSRSGHTTVERLAIVQAGVVTEAIDARLTPLAASSVIAPVLGGTLTSDGASLVIPPAALAGSTALHLTRVSAQGLRGLLPAGWTPLAVVDIAPAAVAFGAPATLRVPIAAVPTGTVLTLAGWDRPTGAWRVQGTWTGDGSATQLEASIHGSGQFAWLRPDQIPVAPAQPAPGELVTGVGPIAIGDTAAVTLQPQPRIIFYEPGVRADVAAVLASAEPLPSGTRFWGRISETYTFYSGAEIYGDPFTQDLFLYQTGSDGLGLNAAFRVSPSMTFEALSLERGVIGIDALAPAPEAEPVAFIGAAGGQLALATGERLDVPGAAAAAAVSMRRLTSAQIGIPMPAGLEFIGGVAVWLSDPLAESATLSIPAPAGIADASRIMLVRLETIDGRSRLVLVALATLEGDRLVASPMLPRNRVAMPGVRVAGRYLFVRAAEPAAFAAGRVLGEATTPFGGALVTSGAFPIVAVSSSDGGYVCPSALGSSVLAATDVTTSDRATAPVAFSAEGEEIAIDLRLAPEPPRVLSVTPASGAADVAQSSAVIVVFSEALNPSSLSGSNAHRISLTAPDGSPVSGMSTLSTGNSVLTFRPSQPLDPDASYTFTVDAAVSDMSGHELGQPLVITFTTLDTTPPPPPPAGSLSVDIPDASGNTTVRGTQGTAGLHDTVTIENVTRGTSTPVLLDPNGGFLVLVQATSADVLKLKIVDTAGNEQVVDLPGFRRENPDGSFSIVAGAAGGHIDGPGGTAMDIRPGTLPDGTIVTLRAVTEDSFPIQLTDDQKTEYSFAGGIEIDFGGITPSKYVDVSIPAAPGDTPEDGWVVTRVSTVAGAPVLEAVDTAKLIGGRVRTSSPPCPGVSGAGTYGIYKSSRPVGLNFAQMYANNYDGLRLGVEYLGVPHPLSFLMPFAVYSYEAPAPICLPVLTGRLTVSQNTVRITLPAGAILPADREIVVRNLTAEGKESHFRRDLLEYAVEIGGTERDAYEAFVIPPEGAQPVRVTAVTTRPGPTGKVIVGLDANSIQTAVAAVLVRNTSRTPALEVRVDRDDLVFELRVGGGVEDRYWITVLDEDGASRALELGSFEIAESAYGPGNLILRALTGTIDPSRDEMEAAAGESGAVLTGRTRSKVELINETRNWRLVIPPEQIVHGGFYFAFQGEDWDSYAVLVTYDGVLGGDGSWYPDPYQDYQAIFRLKLIVSNPQTGEVIKTIQVPAPPRDEPLGLGVITDDREAPFLVGSPARLNSFDPSAPLTFTFSESMNADSIKQGAIVERVDGSSRERVQGDWRVYGELRTATFVPRAPLEIGQEYSVTFVGEDDLAGQIAPGVSAITDHGGNALPTMRFAINTYAPRIVSSLRVGSDGRPLEEIRDLQIRRKTVDGTLRTYLFATTNVQDGAKILSLDVTDAEEPVEAGRAYGGRVQQELTLVPDVGSAGGPTLTYRTPVPSEPAPCGTPGSEFKGDLAVSAGFNLQFSFTQFWDVSNPAAPCMIASKLLTANPEALSSYTTPGTIHALGFAEGVATIRHSEGVAAFVAARDFGLMVTNIGNQMPERLPHERIKEGMYGGDYRDVVAVRDRLVATNSSGKTVDIFDPNLSLLASVELSEQPREVIVAERYATDEDEDGFIRPSEVRDLAFVSTWTCAGTPCTSAIQIIDLKGFERPEVIGTIAMPSSVFHLDVDAERRRLFASGYYSADSAAGGFFIIDISKPTAFAADRDQDGIDDRVIWRKEFPTGLNAPRIDKERGLAYLPVVDSQGARTGHLELWAIYDNCCDLAVDFKAAIEERPTGGRAGLLRKEREALQAGIAQGLTKAQATCNANTGAIAILEQGSGACLWRNNCDDNYQPGLSDHDFELFIPEADFNTSACTVRELTAAFIDPATQQAKPIATPGGGTIAFDDITFFAVVRERFERAELDIIPPSSGGSDAVGDMGLGRRSLLLKWLLEGAYVTGVPGYNVEGRSLESILADLRTSTRIPRVEGYEWASLQEFALAKSKAYLRIKGASDPGSAFHKTFLKQLHDAGKAGIRTTMARMVADETANQLVLSVTREAYDTSACFDMDPSIPMGSWRAKPCTSFEEYVASTAVRSLRVGPAGLFTPEEVSSEVTRFFRIKADREAIVTDAAADAFVALASRFVARARQLTKPAFDALIRVDPQASTRLGNLQSAQRELTKALREAKLALVPHVSSRGFRAARGIRVAMYAADGAGAGTLLKEHTIDLAAGQDRYLAVVQNPDGTPSLSNGRTTPVFTLGPVNLEADQGGVPRGIAFTIDLPDRTIKESKRANNLGGFFYYVLNRETGATPQAPADSPPNPLPGGDELLRPDAQCYDAPTLVTTQTVQVSGTSIGDQAVLGRGEAITISLTVQNLSSERVEDVAACSNITNRCYKVGTLEAGASHTETIEYVTPNEDKYMDGTPSAWSPSTGVLVGPQTRLIVNGSAFVIQPLMDEAVVQAVDASLLKLQAGGTAIRNFRIVGKRTGQPKPNLKVTAELRGFFGSTEQTRTLEFKTNSRGEICTTAADTCSSELNAPDRGLQIPYESSMVEGTALMVTLRKVDDKDIDLADQKQFNVDLVDRAYSQSYAIGNAIEGTIAIPLLGPLGVGGTRSSARGLELSRTGGFYKGPKELSLSVSSQTSSKDSGTFNLLPSVTFGFGAGELSLDASVGNSLSEGEGKGKKYTFKYVRNADPRPGAEPFIIDWDAKCSLASISLQFLAGGNPLINKVLDLFREQPCSDPSRHMTSTFDEAAQSASDTASAKIGFTTPLVQSSKAKLGVSFGLGASATAGFSTKHEMLFAWDDGSGTLVAPGWKQSYSLVGTIDYSAGLTATWSPPGGGGPPPADALVVDKFKRSLSANLTGQTATSGTYAATFEYPIPGTKPRKITVTYGMPKTFGWKATAGGGSGAQNLGGGVPTHSIAYTISRPEDVDLAINRLPNVQAIQAVSTQTELANLELGLFPTRLNQELTSFRSLLGSVVAPYQVTASEGSGYEMPFGLKGKWLGAGLGVGLKFKSDSKLTYPVERGVVFKGEVVPLQRYARDSYLPTIDLQLGDLIGEVWDALEASFESQFTYMSAAITPTQPTTTLRSPRTAIMTINSAAEPAPFDANLYSYVFREIADNRDGLMLPADTAGPAGRPHYGVGGFHQFMPDGRQLAAPAELVIDYRDEDIVGLDESTFAIYGWNQETQDWDRVGGVLDTAANTVTATVDRFRLYTVAPRMPSGAISLTPTDQGPVGSGQNERRRFTVVSGPLLTNDGQPIPDGTLYTVRAVPAGTAADTEYGRLLTADADPTRENVQVAVAGGRVQFEIEYDTPSGFYSPGRVIVYSTTGTAFGSAVLGVAP